MKSPKKSNFKKYVIYILILSIALLIAGLAFAPLKMILSKLFIGLLPFAIALIIVYMLKQPRKLIANKILKNAFKSAKKPQKVRMNIALFIVFILFIVLLVGIFWLIVPKIINVVEDVITNSDNYLSKLEEQLISLVEDVPFLQYFANKNTIDTQFDGLSETLSQCKENLPQIISDVGGSLLNVFNLLIIGLIFAFLILLNIDKYKLAFKDWYSAYKTPTQVYRSTNFIHKTDKILVDYGFSKLIEGTIILASVTLGLIICGSKMPFELAIFMAILNVIPYIGPLLALIPILLVNLVLISVSTALISTLVAVLIVIFVTSFISPLIVGKKIKIDIFTVLLSITIGGALFGAVGMVLAPPITAITIYSIKNAINNKMLNKYYTDRKT